MGSKYDDLYEEEDSWLIRNKVTVRTAMLITAVGLSLGVGALLVMQGQDRGVSSSSESVFDSTFVENPSLSPGSAPVATSPVAESPVAGSSGVTCLCDSATPCRFNDGSRCVGYTSGTEECTPGTSDVCGADPVTEDPVVEPPVTAPVEQSPVETPSKAPIESPVETPEEAPVENPVEEPVDDETIVQTQAPVSAPATAPVKTTSVPTLGPSTFEPTLEPSTSEPTLTPTDQISVECSNSADCIVFGGACSSDGTCVSNSQDDGTSCRGPLDCASSLCGLEEYSSGAALVCCSDGAIMEKVPWKNAGMFEYEEWVCSGLLSGKACAQDKSCASKACVGGVCQEEPVSDQGSCDSDMDCANRRCALQQATENAPLVCCNGGDAHLFDLPWTNEATYVCSQLENGSVCLEYYSCASGVCEENVCVEDECPMDSLKHKPGVCGCGVVDDDQDEDGVADCLDVCPEDPLKSADEGICGCGVSDLDDQDGDGVPLCIDSCPEDPLKTEPGICGCGVSDEDSDSDGVADCLDVCPEDAAKTDSQGECGCGVADVDTDSDGVLDCIDECPDDPDKTVAGVCGCSATTCTCTSQISNVDTDGDGVPDCRDYCPGTTEGNVDSNGCIPLVCSFNLLDHYLGKSSEDNSIIGVSNEEKWELVQCLDKDIYNCGALGGRCMSLRRVQDNTEYLRQVDMWMWTGKEGESNFCQDASFCVLRGMRESDGAYIDPDTVTLKSMSVPDRQVHVGAAGVGPALLHFGGDYVMWNFNCGGEDPVTSTHGAARPDDISCSRRQVRRRE